MGDRRGFLLEPAVSMVYMGGGEGGDAFGDEVVQQPALLETGCHAMAAGAAQTQGPEAGSCTHVGVPRSAQLGRGEVSVGSSECGGLEGRDPVDVGVDKPSSHPIRDRVISSKCDPCSRLGIDIICKKSM